MPEINLPTRHKDADGNWVIDNPGMDMSPAAQRQSSIDYWQHVATATWPDGRPVYTAEARAWAHQQLKELGVAAHG